MRYLITSIIGTIASCSAASTPTLGGPMSHLLVTLHQNQIFVSLESPSLTTVTMQDAGNDFTGAASVLNHSGYNGQFGWLANGFISLPPDAGIFVRAVGGSPHLRVYEETKFEAILGTDGSSDIWRWDGTMTHNWYSTGVKGGVHVVEYEVFVGDAFGRPLDTYIAGGVELSFEYGIDLSGRIRPVGGHALAVPSSGTAVCVCVGVAGMGLGRRRGAPPGGVARFGARASWPVFACVFCVHRAIGGGAASIFRPCPNTRTNSTMTIAWQQIPTTGCC
ncbi:MAG: hypothetical protein WD114_02810 [Phycisphaerales bacterium]